VTPRTDSSSATSPAAQRTALVGDSGPGINAVLDGVLSGEGWGIRRVADNQAILSLAIANPFDLIVTASKSPGPEDIQLLRTIRGVRPHMRIIILTDEWTPGDVVAAMREHAFSYFSGPFEPTALAEMIRYAMASPCWDDGIEVFLRHPHGCRSGPVAMWQLPIAWCNFSAEGKIPKSPQLIGKTSL